jgi:CheY-like chemotaxis protein
MKVIVADDYYTNRLLVSEILKDLGHNFIEAENGQDVVDALEKNDDVDLILMDIEMPVMNGVLAMKYIREKMPYPKNSIPIIALTAHNPGMIMDETTARGFDHMLVKPYSIKKVEELLVYFEKK